MPEPMVYMPATWWADDEAERLGAELVEKIRSSSLKLAVGSPDRLPEENLLAWADYWICAGPETTDTTEHWCVYHDNHYFADLYITAPKIERA